MKLSTETREFPTAVIASLSSGTMLCESFADIHEAAEYLMGHPIWTHQFANRSLWHAIRTKVLEQCPGMPGDLPETTPENCRAIVGALVAEIGPIVRIAKGTGETARHPFDGLPPDTPAILIE